MKLCEDCRKRLPFLFLYMTLLAFVLAAATALVFRSDFWLPTGVFLVATLTGVSYALSGSCRLCVMFRHNAQHAHGRAETPPTQG